MEPEEAQQLCMQKMLEYGLFFHQFVFTWFKSKVTAGYCYATGKKRAVGLSLTLVKDMSRDALMEVILHEIAHALDFIRHGRWRYQYITLSSGKRKRRGLIHDEVWKNIAKEIGLKDPKPYIEIG